MHFRCMSRGLVLGTVAAQEDLVAALMRVYASVDNVVGLDVDKVIPWTRPFGIRAEVHFQSRS
jgi:hypothetical protein